MTNEIAFSYCGKGPAVQDKTDDPEKIAELAESDNWEAVGDYEGYTTEELQQVATLGHSNPDKDVVELGAAEGPTDPDPETLDVDPESEAAELFLTEDERRRLRAAEEQQNPEKVKVEEKEVDELWADMREEYREAISELKEEALEEKVDKAIQNNEFLKDPIHRKSVSELSGSEFVELLEEGMSDSQTSEEELREELMSEFRGEEETDEPQPPMTDEAIEAQLEAADVWEKRGGAWEELAEEMRHEAEISRDSTYVVNEEGGATLSTKHEGVIEDLQMLDEEGDNVEITELAGGVVTAEIDDPSKMEERLRDQ